MIALHALAMRLKHLEAHVLDGFAVSVMLAAAQACSGARICPWKAILLLSMRFSPQAGGCPCQAG